MDRRRGQPLRLGRDDRVDRPSLQSDLAAQSVPLLLIDIDAIIAIVEEALVLLDEIAADAHRRSEEHTSELQSLMRISYAVFCLKHNNHHYVISIPTHLLLLSVYSTSLT